LAYFYEEVEKYKSFLVLVVVGIRNFISKSIHMPDRFHALRIKFAILINIPLKYIILTTTNKLNLSNTI